MASDKRQALRKRIELEGLAPTARAIGVSREALARFVGGLPVQRGTAALIENAIASAPKSPRRRAAR